MQEVMWKKTLCLAAALMLAASLLVPTAAAQSPSAQAAAPGNNQPAKRALILELLEVTGMSKMAGQTMDTMIAQMDSQMPQIVNQMMLNDPDLSLVERERLKQQVAESAARFSKRFRELLPQRVNFGEVMEQLYLPLYDKYFTEAELKDLVAFCKSPTGKKFTSVTPQLLQDAMAKSSEVLGPKVMAVVAEISEEEKKNLKKQ